MTPAPTPTLNRAVKIDAVRTLDVVDDDDDDDDEEDVVVAAVEVFVAVDVGVVTTVENDMPSSEMSTI